MSEKAKILRIVEEDILRILIERRRSISLDVIREEVKVSQPFVFKAIEELEKEKLVHRQQNFLGLTREGEENAKDILRKHLVLENYFKKTRNKEEAHKAAHILEHYVSEEVLNKVKKLSTFRGRGNSILKLGFHEVGMITDIQTSDHRIFERIISMGIFPGEDLRKIREISDGVIVGVNGKNFALSNEIAEKIRVLKNEKL